MHPDAVEAVLLAVEQIPPGRLASYGLIGELVGLGPRQVGAIMASHGSAVAWWRVTSASGELPAHLLATAKELWAAEGIDLKANQRGADYRRHQVDLPQILDAYRLATGESAAEGSSAT